MNSINLSYLVSTKNRLPFLKVLFTHFFIHIQADEEIIVVDADSTDGSKEYLQELYSDGKIHQLIIEKDRNQAHGWNKGILAAKGELIKKIIDDDVHSITAIRQCKKYLLEHPEIDLCISNNLETHLYNSNEISQSSRLAQFREWKTGKTSSFTFSDMTLFIRKSSLSFLGIFDTQFRMLDWEYALRCSYLRANISYYQGFNTLAVSTPGNVTSTTKPKTLQLEGAIGELKYGYKGDAADISIYSKFKIFIGKTIKYKKTQSSIPDTIPKSELIDIYAHLYEHIEMKNKSQVFDFIN